MVKAAFLTLARARHKNLSLPQRSPALHGACGSGLPPRASLGIFWGSFSPRGGKQGGSLRGPRAAADQPCSPLQFFASMLTYPFVLVSNLMAVNNCG